MTTIAPSNIARLRRSAAATRLGAMLALSLAGAVLAGSITPAAAHKHGGGGGKHGHHGQHQPKPPKNPGPIGPLPRPMPMPPTQGQNPTPRPVPVVVRDHRVPKPVVVRDHRATPVIRDHRAPVATSTARPRTTTVKVAGVKILSVKTKGKACVGSYCL